MRTTGDFEGENFEFEGEGEGEGEEYPRQRFRGRRQRFELEQGEFESEDEAAEAFLQVTSEAELEGFIPLIFGALKGLAPIVMKAIVPLLGQIGGRVLSSAAGSAAPPQRPAQGPQQQEQEDFLFGKLLGGLFGQRENEGEQEGYWGHRYWRHRPWGYRRHWGYWNDPSVYTAQETEQEDFLGKILGGLFGEVEGMDLDSARFAMARWYVRLARRSARHAADGVTALANSGARVTWPAVRRIVFDAVQRAAATGGPRPAMPGPAASPPGAAPREPSGASGTWVRRGSKLIIQL